MNNIPRKCLGFKTPKELFVQHHKTFCRAWI
jgi:IS30 family transposase